MLFKAFLRTVLRLIGWRCVGTAPNLPRYVLISSPHTSNWDFLILMTFSWLNDVPLRWMAKESVFKPPMGWLFRAIGGVPIDRSKSNNMVSQMIEAMLREERIVISVPPEGTRKYVPYWKTGFYYLALGANVPVLCCFVDAPNKVFGCGPLIYLSGDLDRDIERFAEFYRPFVGIHAKSTGPVRFKPKEEEPSAAAPAPEARPS